MDDHTMYITPPPTGGAIVALILNILKGYKFTPESVETEDEKIRTYHRIIESFKFGEWATAFKFGEGATENHAITFRIPQVLVREVKSAIRCPREWQR